MVLLTQQNALLFLLPFALEFVKPFKWWYEELDFDNENSFYFFIFHFNSIWIIIELLSIKNFTASSHSNKDLGFNRIKYKTLTHQYQFMEFYSFNSLNFIWYQISFRFTAIKCIKFIIWIIIFHSLNL